MKHALSLFTLLAFFAFKNQAQTTVTDYDGNIYNTVTIGTQVWMKENLKTTHYLNGDLIPNITNGTAWSNLTTDAYCDYNNTPSNSVTYGKLYNWYTVVDSRNVCPIGWHVPTDTEWTILTTYLGGVSVAGGKLKETGTTHWASPNTGATNSSGFTGLPSGRRFGDGTFYYLGYRGCWWSATEETPGSLAWDYFLDYDYAGISKDYDPLKDGMSLRCVKDSTATQMNDINYQDDIQIFPNPAIDKVYINISEKQNLKMQVFNMIGDCVLQRELNNGTNDIDISLLSKGVYVIRLTGDTWTVQCKLTKE